MNGMKFTMTDTISERISIDSNVIVGCAVSLDVTFLIVIFVSKIDEKESNRIVFRRLRNILLS